LRIFAKKASMKYEILHQNCLEAFENQSITSKIDLTFLDPPFNQQKDYAYHNDNMDDAAYWAMMQSVCQEIYDKTNDGGALYFMQREKNTESVLRVLRESGWIFQNLIIWKKKLLPFQYQISMGNNIKSLFMQPKAVKLNPFTACE
jgi:DNA modification methylase